MLYIRLSFTTLPAPVGVPAWDVNISASSPLQGRQSCDLSQPAQLCLLQGNDWTLFSWHDSHQASCQCSCCGVRPWSTRQSILPGTPAQASVAVLRYSLSHLITKGYPETYQVA